MSYNERAVNPIGDFYNLNAERVFLNRQLKQGLGSQQAHEYLLDQQTHFLKEFVGKVPRQKYRYTFDVSEGMKAIGMVRPAAAEYWDLAEKSGANSREWADAIGFSQIDEAFLANKANAAYLISPPSIGQQGFGDYGFLFVFKKGNDNQVYVKIHRYENENISLDQSNTIVQFLLSKYRQNGINITSDPLQILKHPILTEGLNDDGISQNIAELANSRQVNFASDKIAAQKAVQFQEKVIEHPLIKTWINDYTQDMLIASDDRINNVCQKTAMQRAEKIRTAIYNLALELNEGLNKSKEERSFQRQLTPVADLRQYYVDQKPAVVFGGGSCPVSENDRSSGFVDSLLDRGILNHQSASHLTEKKHFNCPKCGTRIQSGQGIAECPSCHLTAKQHAENLEKQGRQACI